MNLNQKLAIVEKLREESGRNEASINFVFSKPAESEKIIKFSSFKIRIVLALLIYLFVLSSIVYGKSDFSNSVQQITLEIPKDISLDSVQKWVSDAEIF
jgi:hypothetical protein